jgi:hypothetical protein
MIKDTNPDHYKVDGANFIEYMNDPKISGFGNWMFANGFNSGVWASTNWISVKDRLPENQNPVMVFVPPHVDEIKGTFLGYVGMAYYTSLGEGFWCGTDGNLYGAIGMIHTPTHWMPLPEPPKEDDLK